MTTTKKTWTNGEITKAMTACTTKKEATAFVKELMKSAEDPKKEGLEESIRSNLGYLTGYLNAEEATRLLDIFETEHPFFGKTRPTAEEAFKMGLAFGEKIKAGR